MQLPPPQRAQGKSIRGAGFLPVVSRAKAFSGSLVQSPPRGEGIKAAEGYPTIWRHSTHQALKRRAPATYAADIGFAESPRCYRSEEHTSELQSLRHFLCRLL